MSDSIDHTRLEPIPEGMGRKTRIAAAAFVVTTIAFWLFAFSPWAREIFTPPDRLEDRALVLAIEGICAAATAEAGLMPTARSAETPAERADVVARTNSILTAMVADLARLDQGSADDQRLIGLWLEDWQIYLDDRTVHVERLRTEGDVRFRMNGFARVNNVDSCETPGDI